MNIKNQNKLYALIANAVIASIVWVSMLLVEFYKGKQYPLWFIVLLFIVLQIGYFGFAEGMWYYFTKRDENLIPLSKLPVTTTEDAVTKDYIDRNRYY